MSTIRPYDRELPPGAISFKQARSIIGLSRRDFRTYAEQYTSESDKVLEPVSVLRIAHAAYREGASRKFFPSLAAVGEDVVEHVREHAPDDEGIVQYDVDVFLALIAGLEEARQPDNTHIAPVPQVLDAHLGGFNEFC